MIIIHEEYDSELHNFRLKYYDFYCKMQRKKDIEREKKEKRNLKNNIVNLIYEDIYNTPYILLLLSIFGEGGIDLTQRLTREMRKEFYR